MALTATGVFDLTGSPPTHQVQSTDSTAMLASSIPRVYGYFYPRVGGNQALAEDLTQDTLLSAVRSATVPDDPEYLIRWLFHIARNKLIDHYRRQDREKRAIGTAIDLDDPGNEPGLPDLDLESLPVREEVAATLAELNPRFQAAIVLRYFDGCDIATVAQALFLSESATSSLLARARAAFRTTWYQRNGGSR